MASTSLSALNAQALSTSETSIALDDLHVNIEFLKHVLTTIYDIKVANIACNTIRDTCINTEDVVHDIVSQSDSSIITKTSQTISQNESIRYPWNESDDCKLHQILTMIYKDNITDIDRYQFDSSTAKPITHAPKQISIIMDTVAMEEKREMIHIKPHHTTKEFNEFHTDPSESNQLRPPMLRLNSLHNKHPSGLRLMASFNKRMAQSLMAKLQRVLEAINHKIDSNQKFLYQIYHIKCRRVQHKDGTIQNEFDDHTVHKYVNISQNIQLNSKAMQIYCDLQKQMNPTVILCNGATFGSYGDRNCIARCTREATEDYKKIKLYLCDDLLPIGKMLKHWESEEYDQQQLLSLQREEAIAVFTHTDSLNMPTLQIAAQLYDKLMKILKFEQVLDDHYVLKDEINDGDESTFSDIMFLWTKKEFAVDVDIKTLDDVHFLYIVSLILNDLKTEFDKVDTRNILRCLRKIRMNGLMFVTVNHDVFTRSVIMDSLYPQDIDFPSFNQLVRCVDRLWSSICDYKLQTQPSICTVSLSGKDDINEEKQKEMNLPQSRGVSAVDENEYVPIYEQWMTVFNAKYNRNTPFDFKFDVFADLMNVYEDNKYAIITMKYENYTTDLNEKTYDDVLKSFIAWAITLKCNHFRCNEKPKLKCFCDTNTFQLYTYNIIMGLIAFKANRNNHLLEILSNRTASTTHIVKEFCNMLPLPLQENEYFKSYKLLVAAWINFEFYNFECNYCHHINKSIMVDRIYECSKSLDSCRMCNQRQISRNTNNRAQFNIFDAVSHKTHTKRFIGITYKEFTLFSLNEYLTNCGVTNKDITHMSSFFISEEYDSEAVIQDIEDDNGNISHAISEYIVNPTSKENNYYHFMRRFVYYHRYPPYRKGKRMRYLLLKPKYSSVVEEICLNELCPLSIQQWNTILTEASKEYNKNKDLYCNVTDNRFGVEEGEPMGIHHLISIFVFTGVSTEHTDRLRTYRRCFNKSYYVWPTVVHCNNFYWLGRYLYEAVKFYGKSFTKKGKDTVLSHVIRTTKSFNSVAPTFNSPILTKDVNEIASQFLTYTGKGCVLALCPKYYGDIDNSKFLDAVLFNKPIRLLNSAKVQVRSIEIMHPRQPIEDMLLAMQYIEKLFCQTTYCMHFYNADDLYTPENISNAYLLISGAVHVSITPYVRHLFENWCFKREFITLETFKSEVRFMNHKLAQFLFDKISNKINIDNVKKLLPNLKHYRDPDGILRNADLEIKRYYRSTHAVENNGKPDQFGLLYNCQEHDIPIHIVDALERVHFNFRACDGVLREATRMQLSKLDINAKSLKSRKLKEHVQKIGIANDIVTRCIRMVMTKHCISETTDNKTLIEWMLDELYSGQKWKGIECDVFLQKEAFKELYSKDLTVLKEPIMKREKVKVKDLYKVAKEISIFTCDEAMSLSKYLYIKMMDDKEKARPWICKICDFLNCKRMVDGLWRYYNETNKCGLCGLDANDDESIQEQKAEQTAEEDKQVLSFLTKKQQTNDETASKFDSEEREQDDSEETKQWTVSDNSECKWYKSVKYLSTETLVGLLDDFMNQIHNAMHKKIILEHRDTIREYFMEKQVDGLKFTQMTRKEFRDNVSAHCGNKKINAALLRLYLVMSRYELDKHDTSKDDISIALYNELYIDCPAAQRVKTVLQQFEGFTNNLQSTNNIYLQKIHSFLSTFPIYNPVLFSNDIAHIIKHDIKHPRNLKCSNGHCVHFTRAQRNRNRDVENDKSININLKKQFFNTNYPSDFVYISMLDRAHCLLYHWDDPSMEMNENIELLLEDATKSVYSQYNSGVYMEYHALNPLYQNLFDEIVENEQPEIVVTQFCNALSIAKKSQKAHATSNKWRACKTDLKYGIQVNEPLHIEHVLCVRFYCKYPNYCDKFRDSYRMIYVGDTKDDIIRRHCNNFYWFGRFLTAAIEFWGVCPRKSVYHALPSKFVFDQFSIVTTSTTATTLDINTAHAKSDRGGIVLKLSPKYVDEVNNSRFLDISAISNNERQSGRLFGGMAELSITNIYCPSDNAWKGYGNYVAALLYFERIIEQTNQRKQYYNYGKLSKKNQKMYLVPLIKHQMKRNDQDQMIGNELDEDDTVLPRYICVLFENFCDNKRDYIDLSCINEEIPLMDDSLLKLFVNIVLVVDTENASQYKINNENITRIFPNLEEYKNHMSHWIYVGHDYL
eukprot:911391_1